MTTVTIPEPQRDEQGKILGDFYPLQRAELIALKKARLINNTAYVHLALRYENPYCDRPLDIDIKKFAMHWGIAESSVYEAIAKLKDAKVIKTKSSRITVEWGILNKVMILGIQNLYGIPENILRIQNPL